MKGDKGADGVQQEISRIAQTAAENHDFGVKGPDEVIDGHGQIAGEGIEYPEGGRITFLRGVNDQFGIDFFNISACFLQDGCLGEIAADLLGSIGNLRVIFNVLL